MTPTRSDSSIHATSSRHGLPVRRSVALSLVYDALPSGIHRNPILVGSSSLFEMDSRHPPRSDEFPLESTSRGTRSLPARASARRRDGDDVGGTLQVIEPDAEEYDEESEASEEESAGKRRRTKSGKASVRRQIAINYINDKSRRNITFNKRKTGILKKVRFRFALSLSLRARVDPRLRQAHELSVLTGADVLLLIASRDTEQVYTFSTPNMYPLTSDPAGRQNIQNCLVGLVSAPR